MCGQDKLGEYRRVQLRVITERGVYEMVGMHDNYTRGLRVTEVRQHSPAEQEGILAGDIIVAMHGWKTETVENLAFVLEEELVKNEKDFMFYILRDREPFWGQMRIASRDVARR